MLNVTSLYVPGRGGVVPQKIPFIAQLNCPCSGPGKVVPVFQQLQLLRIPNPRLLKEIVCSKTVSRHRVGPYLPQTILCRFPKSKGFPKPTIPGNGGLHLLTIEWR